MKTPKSKVPAKLKSITRVDQKSRKTHGWYVRVRYQGITHFKFFADNIHGGKSISRKAAIAWRNDTESRLGKPRTDLPIVTVSKTPTGVVGVRLNEELNRYEISWVKPDGKKGKTSVSIRRHGPKGAFIRACKIREEKEAERLASK